MGHYFVGLLNNMCYTGNTDTCYQPIENFALTASSENFLNSTLFGNNFDQNLLDQDLFQNVPSCISTLEEPLPTDDIERYLNAISEISSELELSDYSSPLSSPNSFSSSPLSSPMYSPMPTSPVQNEVVSNLVRTDKAGPQDWTVHLNGEEKTYRETALYHDVQWVPELFYKLFRENHPDPKNEEFYKGNQGCIYLLRGNMGEKHKPPVLPNGKWKCHTLPADRIEHNTKGWRYNIPKTTLCCKVIQWIVDWNGERSTITMYHYYHTNGPKGKRATISGMSKVY